MFDNLKIATRLKITLGVLMGALVAVAGVALWEMSAMRASTQSITGNWLPSVELVNKVNTNASDFRIQEIQHVMSTDAKEMAALEQEAAKMKAEFDKNHDAYVKLISSPQERKLYDAFAADWALYLQLHTRLIEMSRKNETERARALLDGESKVVYDRFSATLLKLVDFNHAGSTAEAKESDSAFTIARNSMAIAVALSLALGLAAGIWLIRAITGPLGKALETADRVAAGDLTGAIDRSSNDEAGLVLQALDRMQDSLSSVVSKVRQNAESVATASAQIAQGNQDLSQRTEEQASALEETAATMEQLGATVRHTADNARQANQLAQGASVVATQGGAVVGEVVTAMRTINDSSRRIGDIIGVIDGIAFQTNILALNAAVEAARAGEQGRGFAVVAGEVRTLAQRSAEAAKEIKTLIGASIEQVAQGTALVDQAGKTMGEIVTAIQRVSDIVAEISSASVEQSSGVQQVGDAVSQMDQATQKNAALVEESAAAAASLKSRAQELVHAVAVFKLEALAAHLHEAPAAPAAHVERRGPDRAKNVTRPVFNAKRSASPASTPTLQPPAKTGNDDWTSF